MCSPFLGGGSIELHMAATGVKVYCYDAFQPLIDFWQQMQLNPTILANEITPYLTITKDQFYQLQQNSLSFSTQLQRAAAFFALNKSSFSGATFCGGFSLHNSRKRLTNNAITRISQFYNPNMIFQQLDYQLSILQHSCFMYLDPPYLIKRLLYGNKGDLHKSFNHLTLCNILKSRDNWVMSYNDCPEIRHLYADCQIISVNWKYGMANTGKSNEILIIKERP
jgi:DNA adenine methylase